MANRSLVVKKELRDCLLKNDQEGRKSRENAVEEKNQDHRIGKRTSKGGDLMKGERDPAPNKTQFAVIADRNTRVAIAHNMVRKVTAAFNGSRGGLGVKSGFLLVGEEKEFRENGEKCIPPSGDALGDESTCQVEKGF